MAFVLQLAGTDIAYESACSDVMQGESSFTGKILSESLFAEYIYWLQVLHVSQASFNIKLNQSIIWHAVLMLITPNYYECTAWVYWWRLTGMLLVFQLSDCSDEILRGAEGVYAISADGTHSFPVYCQTEANHTWTVIQQRCDGSTSFQQYWQAYKEGFGVVGTFTNYW